jgi:hypothetical protein
MDRDGVEIMTIRCQDNVIITIKTVRLLRPAPKLRLLVNLQKLDDKKPQNIFLEIFLKIFLNIKIDEFCLKFQDKIRL